MSQDSQQGQPNRVLYQERPFLYLVAAGIGYGFGRASTLAMISSSILLLASLTIYAMRWHYSHRNKEIEQKYKEPTSL